MSLLQGCVGTRECGMVFTVRLEEEFDEGTLSYQFRFSEEYGKNGGQWTLGGKLPGLAGVCCSYTACQYIVAHGQHGHEQPEQTNTCSCQLVSHGCSSRPPHFLGHSNSR